jgi:hypothetical protein
MIGRVARRREASRERMIAMINVKEAVKKAIEYFMDLYGDQFSHVLVEEIERDLGDWLVTLGYDDFSIHTQIDPRGPRRFKVFKIKGDTGEVISMKIREVEHVEQ